VGVEFVGDFGERAAQRFGVERDVIDAFVALAPL